MTETSQGAGTPPPAGPGTARKGTGGRRPSRARDNVPARQRPVARVAVDIPLAHLDRPFDYLVPERLAGSAVPGCRVRVRFSGQLVDGFVLARADASDHPGRLSYLDRVVSPEPVLTPEIAGLARAVADRYAGTLADVLRLAIPPRHAGTEAKPWKSIARAGSAKELKPGDTVLIHSGVYREHARITVSGELGKPVTFAAAPGATFSTTGARLPPDGICTAIVCAFPLSAFPF